MNESPARETTQLLQDAGIKWRWALVLILTIAGVSYFYRLGSLDFTDTLEVRRAMIARDMIERGDWLVPHLKGNAYLTKPPLVYWAMALVGTLAGNLNETTSRIPSVVAALGGIALTFLIGKALFEETTGLLAALMLATTSLYYSEARYAELDMALVAFMLLSVWAYWSGQSAESAKQRLGFYLLFFAAMGLAFMCKGPLGIIVPLAPAVLTLLLTRDGKRFRAVPWFRGTAVLLCVIAPWVIALEAKGYPLFGIFREEMGARFSETFRHQKPFKFYFSDFDKLAFPWSFLLVPMAAVGVTALVRGRKSLRALASRVWQHLAERNGRLLYLLVWLIGVTLLLSLMPVKRNYYFLPAIPAWALLGAAFVAAMARKSGQRSITRRGWHVSGALALAALGLVYLAARTQMKPEDFSGRHFIDAHLLFIICGVTCFLLAVLAALKRLHVIALVAALAAAIIVGQFYFAARYAPLLNASGSPGQFCREILKQYPNAQFIAYREDNFAIQYYLGRYIDKTDDLAQVRQFLASNPKHLALTTNRIWQEDLQRKEFEVLLRAVYRDDDDKAPLLFRLSKTFTE